MDLYISSTYMNTGIVYVSTLLFVTDDQLAIADSKTTTLREYIFRLKTLDVMFQCFKFLSLNLVKKKYF